jgi:hypothetical protein
VDAKSLLTAIAKKDTLGIQESFEAIMADKTRTIAEEVLSEQAVVLTSGITLNSQDEV